VSAAAAALRELLPPDAVLEGRGVRPFLHDATEVQGLVGSADAVVLPTSPEQVAAVVRWCYERGVAITPQGGRTGYAGGAVPNGGIVLALDRMRRVRSFDPLLWRGEFEAGVTTAEVRRRARENGLLFPPDPGAAEQSQIGGNVATNAGGPHAFKYGVTGKWVTGVEAVIPPGDIVRVGGLVRKDVAGYDLKSLLIGSEGTLGVITAIDLAFMPAVEAALPLIAAYPDELAGTAAVAASLASGIVPAALEYIDGGAVDVVRAAFPGTLPESTGFVVIAEADGSAAEAAAGRSALREVLAPGACWIDEPSDPPQIQALWRWRDGVGLAVDAALGGKVSEDIVVPIDRLADAIDGTREIGSRHGLRSCSWGHAGDGNLHSTFMFSLALRLGGSISGEHGLGVAKSGHLRDQWAPRAVSLHRGVKDLFDPKGLLNPGTKTA
jgi:FAD/FMN-containing dehydrogenase